MILSYISEFSVQIEVQFFLLSSIVFSRCSLGEKSYFKQKSPQELHYLKDKIQHFNVLQDLFLLFTGQNHIYVLSSVSVVFSLRVCLSRSDMTLLPLMSLDFLMGMPKIGEPTNKLRLSVGKRDAYDAKNLFYCHISSFKSNPGSWDRTSGKFPVVNWSQIEANFSFWRWWKERKIDTLTGKGVSLSARLASESPLPVCFRYGVDSPATGSTGPEGVIPSHDVGSPSVETSSKSCATSIWFKKK